MANSEAEEGQAVPTEIEVDKQEEKIQDQEEKSPRGEGKKEQKGALDQKQGSHQPPKYREKKVWKDNKNQGKSQIKRNGLS